MAYAFVRATPGALGTGSSTPAIAFSANTAAGNRAILAIATWWDGGTPTASVSDAKNGSWHLDVSVVGTEGSFKFLLALFSVQLASALLTTDNITITLAASVDNNHVGGYAGVLEYSGLSTATNPIDVSATNNGNSTAPSTGTTGATTAANELVLIAFGDDALNPSWVGGNPPTGYTARVDHMGDSTNADLWVGEKGSGSSGSTQSGSGTLVTSNPWAMLVAVYKLAGAGPADPFPLAYNDSLLKFLLPTH